MPMKRISLFVVAGCMVAAGCAGSGDVLGGGGGTGTTVSLAAKVQTADAVVAYAKTLDASNTATFMNNLAAKMRTMPGFKDVELGDGEVGAHFQDGEPYAFVNNRPSTGIPVLPKMHIRALHGEIPNGKRFAFQSAMGTNFTNVASILSTWMADAGWLPGTGSFTVTGLPLLCGSNDVIFLDAHGSMSTGEYLLWTQDKVGNPATDLANKPYMDEHSIAFFDASFNTAPGNPGYTVERHYAIKTAYVTKYLDFKPNSFVMNNGCSGAAYGPFVSAIKAKKANAYLAWSKTAFDLSSALAAYALFDKMLGTSNNGNDQENPHQRAFDLDSVYDDLNGRGILTDASNGTHLQLYEGGGTFGLLRPTIKNLTVKGYERELWIDGDFGTRTGTVTINGVAAALKGSWSATQLKVVLPDSGAGSCGPVVVQVSGHKSKPVMLSHWEGDLVYEDKHTAIGDTVDVKVQFHISLRARVQDYRDAPHTTPVAQIASGTCDRTSSCHWTCTGAQGNGAVPWTGSGNPPQAAPGPSTLSKLFQVGYQFDVNAKQLKLAVIAVDKNAISIPTTGIIGLPFLAKVFDQEVGLFNLPTLNISLLNDFSIPGNSRTYQAAQYADRYTLQWGTMTTAFPPDDKDPR